MAQAIRTALVSVSDKQGIVELARELLALGVRILSTGGTAAVLRGEGIAVSEVAELTGAPEILGGRVKTLHPRVHGGLLGRATPEHRAEMRRHGIEPIDLVVVNLYPFEATVARGETTVEEAIEQIDIGGPAMLRSAAKNHERVTVITDPRDYPLVIEELRTRGGTSIETRRRLARKVFAATAGYDAAIAAFLERLPDAADESERLAQLEKEAPPARLPPRLSFSLERRQILRYGENPHQEAALYLAPLGGPVSLAGAEVLQGKELSYNNLVDLDAALQLVLDMAGPCAAIIKHTNPCGAALSDEAGGVLAAYRAARAADPVSAFGGIVAVNRIVEADLAIEWTDIFLECVIAPGYTEGARAQLRRKPNLRVLRYQEQTRGGQQGVLMRSISGGLLVQSVDAGCDEVLGGRVVTERAPGPDEQRALDFAWRVCKHVKSNAIVLCQPLDGGVTAVGVGAGQMSRVDAVDLALRRAGDRARGSALASDAFFPFRDGIDAAARGGVRAVAQPGGSMRDAEVIAAANEHNIAMIVTGKRHFRH